MAVRIDTSASCASTEAVVSPCIGSMVQATTPATPRPIAYTTNGALSDAPVRIPPRTGPVMPPSTNPPLNRPDARPSRSDGVTENRSVVAPIVNIADPTPPAARAMRNCQYEVAAAHHALETATISTPATMTRRSARRRASFAAIGRDAIRTRVKLDATAPAASVETPNVRAKRGRTGETMPKPRATRNAMIARTRTGRGIRTGSPYPWLQSSDKGKVFLLYPKVGVP